MSPVVARTFTFPVVFLIVLAAGAVLGTITLFLISAAFSEMRGELEYQTEEYMDGVRITVIDESEKGEIV